jgi:hypothetical protein
VADPRPDIGPRGMTLCIATGGTLLALAVQGFTLSWTHSVARTTWWERWEVSAEGLRPVEARISGSGAGMEPPDGAVLADGVWSYIPTLPSQREVLLAASGMTGGGWQLCTDQRCWTLGSEAGAPTRLWAADRCVPDG